MTMLQVAELYEMPPAPRVEDGPFTSSDCYFLAQKYCTQCSARGLYTQGALGDGIVCSCVYRSAFHACFRKYRELRKKQGTCSAISMETFKNGRSRRSYTRASENYLADFELVAQRTLRGHKAHYTLFRWMFLLGADDRLLQRKCHINPRELATFRYAVEELLGRVFVHLKPFGLYPLDTYFRSSSGGPAEIVRSSQGIADSAGKIYYV